MKTLLRRNNPLSLPEAQLKALNGFSPAVEALPKFETKLESAGVPPLHAQKIEALQINLGKMCNQTCQHCHVDAGPDRTEIMTRDTMSLCLEAIRTNRIAKVDLTGGAPEMNPSFRWFVEALRELDVGVMVRCNLTILLAGKAYEDLPEFFAKHRVHVVSSLPCYEQANTDRMRGIGVFNKSIQALQRLNRVGYGQSGSGLLLDLVYNPVGLHLAGDQQKLEVDFKRELKRLFDIEFNHLLAITNLPVSRFLEHLVETGNLEMYLGKLIEAFNPSAVPGLMCRTLLSVSWNGNLYDCDFNQMLEMPLGGSAPRHIRDFSLEKLESRPIVVNQHCFGCTAGQGSSCGGSVLSSS